MKNAATLLTQNFVSSLSEHQKLDMVQLGSQSSHRNDHRAVEQHPTVSHLEVSMIWRTHLEKWKLVKKLDFLGLKDNAMTAFM